MEGKQWAPAPSGQHRQESLPADAALLSHLKQNFATVCHAKPPASRAESAEVYVVAMGKK